MVRGHECTAVDLYAPEITCPKPCELFRPPITIHRANDPPIPHFVSFKKKKNRFHGPWSDEFLRPRRPPSASG